MSGGCGCGKGGAVASAGAAAARTTFVWMVRCPDGQTVGFDSPADANRAAAAGGCVAYANPAA